MTDPVNNILTRYSDDVSFRALLSTLGVSENERTQFTEDRFTSMSLLVKNFSYDVGSFKSYLQTLNKTFANTITARSVYFNPDSGTPIILSLYCNNSIKSVAILSAMNSGPKVEVSIVFCLSLYHWMDAMLMKIIIPVYERRVTTLPAWSESTKILIFTGLSLGSGILSGSGFSMSW